MKPDIHPEYTDSVVTCACGSVIHTRSTQAAIHVDVCSNCHPFFTGEQRIVDTAGRVERFRRRYARAQQNEADGDSSGDESGDSVEAPAEAVAKQ